MALLHMLHGRGAGGNVEMHEAPRSLGSDQDILISAHIVLSRETRMSQLIAKAEREIHCAVMTEGCRAGLNTEAHRGISHDLHHQNSRLEQ